MNSISPEKAKNYGNLTVVAAWLAVFCLFGYRSSFSVMQKAIITDTGWSSVQVSLGYCVMMTVYAITAFFSGSLVDKKGTRPSYAIGALCCFLGFFLTSMLDITSPNGFYMYLFTYGLFAGIGTGMLWVSATVSCRKWYVGARYGTAWGLAFMGAPMAQLLLTLVLKPILISMGWQVGMKVLSFIMAVLLIGAATLARRSPADYGVQPFGLDTLKKGSATLKAWTIGEAFSSFATWCVIFAFMTSMLAEFLVWSQLVSYFQVDMGLPLATASNIYIIIGISGIFAMPLTGRMSDAIVKKLGNERLGRKIMLIFAPACGALAVLLLFTKNIPAIIVAMVLLSIYWGIEPGGCAGYLASFFGGPSYGRIWGLCTLIIMGIGPSTGTFMGAWFKDTFGSYTPALIFCLCAYIASTIFGAALPLKLKVEKDAETTTEAA